VFPLKDFDRGEAIPMADLNHGVSDPTALCSRIGIAKSIFPVFNDNDVIVVGVARPPKESS